MPLTLTLTLTQTSGGGDRQTRALSGGTLSIGRAAGNDWVLADPDQHLSRTHCMISFENGRYVLTDLSTNGMLVNGARQPTTRNSRIILTDGDFFQLGGYTITAAEADDFAHPAGAAEAGPLDVDPLADPLADPLGVPLGQAAAGGFSHPVSHAGPAARVADPFDQAPPGGAGGRAAEPDDDLFRGKSPAESWTGPTQSDTADAVAFSYTAPKVITPANIDEIDFDELIGDMMPSPSAHPLDPRQPAAPAGPGAFSGAFQGAAATDGHAIAMATGAAQADAFDDLIGDFPGAPAAVPPAMPPTPAPVVVPVIGPSPAPPVAAAQMAPRSTAAPAPGIPAAAGALSGNAALAAFLDGAGVPRLDLSDIDPEVALRSIGALFHAFVAGTRDVLMSRTEIKHELRVEQTMLRARDNNALKFSVSAEEALAALLRPNRPGYKAPLAAVQEAFTDVRSHEMAVMAGLQTALIALLKRFDPAALEGRLKAGMLDSILPGARKARFWELFCATYKDIAHEAEDDFHSVFGREFARAYDAQIRKL